MNIKELFACENVSIVTTTLLGTRLDKHITSKKGWGTAMLVCFPAGIHTLYHQILAIHFCM